MFTIDMTGKRAWVTGGSRGIGRAVVLALADAGCDVAIGYRSAEAEAAEVKALVEAKGRRAVLLRGHVGSRDECERMHDEAAAALGGGFDALVCNAGIHRNNLFLTMEESEWAEVLETNLMGTVHPIKAALKWMWARKAGRIVTISSVATLGGGRGQANYVASKGAVEAMTRNLAVELAPRGITINCIAPGAIETTMWEEGNAPGAIERQLVKRFGTPEEIAAWVVMFCSDHSAFITGEVLNVNGGWQKGWDVKKKGPV